MLLLTTWGGTRYGWGSPAIIALALVVLAALVAYLAVERRAAAPSTPLRLFRSSVFTISAVQFLLATMVLAGQNAADYAELGAATVPFMAVALVLALVMREKPLSKEIVEIAEGKAEAPEY